MCTNAVRKGRNGMLERLRDREHGIRRAKGQANENQMLKKGDNEAQEEKK